MELSVHLLESAKSFPKEAEAIVCARRAGSGGSGNSLHTPNQVQLDLRVLKYFKIGEHGKLDLVAESFNLLNHTNVIGLNQFFGPSVPPISAFATPARAGISRQLQFSIDFEF